MERVAPGYPFRQGSDHVAGEFRGQTGWLRFLADLPKLPVIRVVQKVVSQLFPGRVFRYAAPWSVRWRSGGMIDFKGSQFEKDIILWGVRW
jgi:hypothetical protein